MVVSNHFHSVKNFLISSAKTSDFDGMLGIGLPMSMYTTKTSIDKCSFNITQLMNFSWGSVAVFQCHPFLSQGVLFHLTGRKEHISFWYISLFLYNDFMFEYYIIFLSFSLNDIYWIQGIKKKNGSRPAICGFGPTFSNPVKSDGAVETVQLRTCIKQEVKSLSDRCTA